MPVSPRTQQAYFACVCQWAEHFKTPPDLITPEQLRQYFIHLKCIKKVARQTSTQALCAIKLFWEKSLRRVWPVELELVRAQPRFKLPVILSAQEVRLILSFLPSGYHRVRLFGWFHPASRKKLNRVRGLLKQNPLLTQAERDAWQPGQEKIQPVQPAEEKPARTPECPHCHKPMVLVGTWRAGQSPLVLARAPP